MPNHCNQTVTFKGKPLIIKVLYESVLAESLCQIVKPMPFKLRCREGDSAYFWAVHNWGTKWDIADPVVLKKSWKKESELWVSKREASFTFECWTAYAPPFPIWEELINKHQIKINASYTDDDGGFFNGTFIDGERKEWDAYAED